MSLHQEQSNKKDTLTLYHYWRSSCSWRVRWALRHKGVAFNGVHINLLQNEQNSPAFLAKNPAGFLPAMEWKGEVFGESMAILEWIEDMWPHKPLLPASPTDRMRVRQMSQMIISGIQPIQNLSVLKKLSPNTAEQTDWAKFWIERGLCKLEEIVAKHAGTYCFGGSLTFADLCLVPQIYNANRFQVSLESFPTLKRVHTHCSTLAECIWASPENHQPT